MKYTVQAVSHWWVRMAEAWELDGTFDNIDAAKKSGRRVNVPRSDGTMSRGTILGIGYCGLGVEVEFETAEGTRYKTMRTEKFLGANPELVGSRCVCDEPDGSCEGCGEPHGHTCRACDEEWCQVCWEGREHDERCPHQTREARAG